MLKTALKRYKRINPISAKRRRQRAARLACVAAVLKRDGYKCTFWAHVPQTVGAFREESASLNFIDPPCCDGQLDVHEPLMRSHGADPTDPDQCITLCRSHHTWSHNHPLAAEQLGLIVREMKGEVVG